uniref:Uncharacterized protein n=1 Tax=Schistosoma haematobium TaxID=6185 RepID=A0A095CAI6_SCHHA
MTTTSVAAVSASVGLNIHKGKVKILKYNTENINTATLDGEALWDRRIWCRCNGKDWQSKDSIATIEEHMELKTTVCKPTSKSEPSIRTSRQFYCMELKLWRATTTITKKVQVSANNCLLKILNNC